MRRETILALTSRKTDSDGNPIGDPIPGVPIPGCVIWPRASEEKDGGEVNIDGQNVRCPDVAVARALESDDLVEIRGQVHMVDEPPAYYVGKAVMLKTKRVTT